MSSTQPQYWNPVTKQYESVEGQDGAINVSAGDGSGVATKAEQETQSTLLTTIAGTAADQLAELLGLSKEATSQAILTALGTGNTTSASILTTLIALPSSGLATSAKQDAAKAVLDLLLASSLAIQASVADIDTNTDGLEALQTANNASAASIDGKTPELWFGRTSDGGVATRTPRRIVSASCTDSVDQWKAIVATGGTFAHDPTTLTGLLSVTGASGSSVFARSIQTFYVTPDVIEAKVSFQFGASHANITYEIGIFAADLPLLGPALAENNGTYTINVYDSGFPIAQLPTTLAYALNGTFHTFKMLTYGAKNAAGRAQFFVDDVLIAETIASAVGLPARPMRSFDLAARVQCTGVAVAASMYLGDGTANSFIDDAYPSIVMTAERATPIAIAAAWYPLVAIRASKLGGSARPTLWPRLARLFFSASGQSTGRVGFFHNRTGTTKITGGTWARDAGMLFDYNSSATAFDVTGLSAIGGTVPITTGGEGTLIELPLDDLFSIGHTALCNWPDAGGSYEECVLAAFETSGSLSIDASYLLVTQPRRGPA